MTISSGSVENGGCLTAAKGSDAVIAVCSNRVRPAVHTTNKNGHQWWARDTFHLALPSEERTLCGRLRVDWLVIGDVTLPDVNCCVRCATKVVAARPITPPQASQ